MSNTFTSEPHHPPAFPIVCPSCSSPTGMPTLAATRAGTQNIDVQIRCRDCRHEWQIEMPAPIPPTPGVS